ncbi:MAG: enoyl-CoA hydratase/isomerase family protein [Reyranellaceae bacterium]
MFETIRRVGIIELNRPAKFNAINEALWAELTSALRALEAADVRVVLLRARGKNFCTGGDLAAVKEMRTSRARWADFIRVGHESLRALEASRLPVVAAIQGLCLAGGLEIALACDVAFAAKNAQFGDQHSNYGLIPGAGGTQRLPRAIGLRRALDFFYSGKWADAETAMQFGLVNYVVEPERLHEAAMQYCAMLAERSPHGLVAMKRLARGGLHMEVNEALRFEEEAVVDELLHEDISEGLAAFEARRKPVFGS